jgi:predicted nucleic acid-binding protein
MIVLDTNVISTLMTEAPDPRVIAWLNLQRRDAIWTNALTLYEMRFGIEDLPDGKRKTGLMARLDNFLEYNISRRVLNFDSAAAHEAAKLEADRARKGKSIDKMDTMIAGIAIANRAAIATRNVRHFADIDVKVINPWED